MRVLLDVPEKNWRKNFFIGELVRHLGPEVEVIGFDRGFALRGSYDVVHSHWPEHRVSGTARWTAAKRRAAWAAWTLRLAVRGIPVVRTRHNRQPHEAVSRVDRILLRAFERRVRGQVFLSEESRAEVAPDPGPDDVVILHGTYDRWIDRLGVDVDRPRPLVRPHALVSPGFLRPYKNLEEGIAAVAATDDFALTIAGPAHDKDYVATLQDAAKDAPHVSVLPGRLPKKGLVDLVLSSDAVLLPYTDIYNSGVVFLALGLGRPVIVRDNQISRALRDEWGAEWIGTYEGLLTPASLRQAWAAVSGATGRPTGDPGRSWTVIAEQHTALYGRLARR